MIAEKGAAMSLADAKAQYERANDDVRDKVLRR